LIGFRSNDAPRQSDTGEMKNRRVVLVSRPPTGGPQAENIRVEDITPHGRLGQQRLHASETGLQKMGSASSSMSQT
jgi:hypothetical protein